jgi:hypothetical protein
LQGRTTLGLREPPAAGKRLSRRSGGGGDRNGIIKEMNGKWDKCRRRTLRKSRDCHDRRIFLGHSRRFSPLGVFCLVHASACECQFVFLVHPIHYCQTFAPTPGKSFPSIEKRWVRREATWNLLFLDWVVVNTYFLMKHMVSSFTGLQYYTSANWGLRH